MSTISAEQPVGATRANWAFGALTVRTVVAGLFIISAIGKIMAPLAFAEQIRQYEMAPIAVTNAVAFVLPWIELIAATLLLTCLWRKEARGIIAVMLLVFTVAKVYAYMHGRVIDCGCGGNIPFLDHIYDNPQGIFTNLVLLAMLWVDWRSQRLAGGVGSSSDGAQPRRQG